MDHTIQEEVDRNFESFQEMLPTIIRDHRGKHALMKDRKILGYYSSANDASIAASTFIKDGLFSIQHVTDSSINLGFFNYAVPGVPIHP
jgi:hypothetical protein